MPDLSEAESQRAVTALSQAVELHGRNREDLPEVVTDTARAFYAFLTNPTGKN